MSRAEIHRRLHDAFLRGMASVAIPPSIEVRVTGYEDDLLALRSDWEAVGHDLRNAIERTARELEAQRENAAPTTRESAERHAAAAG